MMSFLKIIHFGHSVAGLGRRHICSQRTTISIYLMISKISKQKGFQTLCILILLFFDPPFNQLGDFEAIEATIGGIHDALFNGGTTCRAVVEAHLARIETLNPTINAIISLNKDSLKIADQYDEILSTGNASGPLFCIPTLLKDNFDTRDMPTTGGCLALKDHCPTEDAAVVSALKEAGAVILGKTNLHDMALEGLSVSSLGGQTLNPYDLTRTPGGSSGGTGAAIAASFAVVGTGTDTMNSLRSPASANSLYSIRPTKGLISRAGVIPVSSTQDSVGPIARTIEDLAILLSVMANASPEKHQHVAHEGSTRNHNHDSIAAANGPVLGSLCLGLIQGFVNASTSSEVSPVNEVMNKIISAIRAHGGSVVPIESPDLVSSTILESCDTQRFEYREQLNKYLSTATGAVPRSLNELYSSRDFLVIPRQYPFIESALISSTRNHSYASKLRHIEYYTRTVEAIFKEHNLDALIYPEQSNLVVRVDSPSQIGRNGILAAVTGFPVVTVPIGFSSSNQDAPLGIPIGMEILGPRWSEAKLIQIAQFIHKILPSRKPPQLDIPLFQTCYRDVPFINPNASNIPSAYPVGSLGRTHG